jgi:hypothetical protein
MATARPIRSMAPYAEQFWAFTREKEPRLQQCSDCGKFRWPPGPTCDRCLSDAFARTALSGTATVLSWTTFRRRTRWSRSSWRRGPLFISCPVALDPTALREGMTLDLRWTDGADKFGEYNLPVFGPPASQA